MRVELLRLKKLHDQAERLAYSLLARLDRTGLCSPFRNQLERLSDKACQRATRRYETSMMERYAGDENRLALAR